MRLISMICGAVVGAAGTGVALCQQDVPKILAGVALAVLIICAGELLVYYNPDLLAPTNDEIEQEIAEHDPLWRD
jgi:hypothetical protein